MKKLSRKIVCIFSSTVLFCGATGMTADAETNRITFESNLTELNTSLKYGNKLNPDLNLSEMLEARGNNYNKIPNGIFEPVEGKIDLSLKASLKHSDLTLTPNEIAEGKKVTLEVQTQNAALYRNFGTIKYQWFGPRGLISNANSRTYETNDIGSYYCYVWIDYDFYSNDDNDNILNLPDDSNEYVPFFRPQLVRPSGLIWKVPEGAVKTNTATVRLIDDLVIEQQPIRCNRHYAYLPMWGNLRESNSYSQSHNLMSFN